MRRETQSAPEMSGYQTEHRPQLGGIDLLEALFRAAAQGLATQRRFMRWRGWFRSRHKRRVPPQPEPRVSGKSAFWSTRLSAMGVYSQSRKGRRAQFRPREEKNDDD